MKFLVFTTLYPNAAMPTHGVFVENRLRAFLKTHDAEVKVIAPVPWFPIAHEKFGAYGRWAQVPPKEIRHGVEIFHPRYVIPPKIGMNIAPASLARCLRKSAYKLIAGGWDFDLIDAHYLYPDAVAATMVAAELGKPAVVTARGSDVNLIPKFKRPRKMILDAAIRADTIITVAEALRIELINIGAPAQKITTLRNGVDLDIFAPGDRERIRKDMTLEGPVIASVGHLIDRKGHDIVIDALKDIPGATLLIVGEGQKRQSLEMQAARAGLEKRVRFLGALPHERMADIYNAADVLALASDREGWPNVLLEAMACGTPCVASDVWGAKEVIREPTAGDLIENRTPEEFAKAIVQRLNHPCHRSHTRAYAQKHSWEETVNAMAAIFSRVTKKEAIARAVSTQTVTASKAAAAPKLIVTVDTEERFDWSNLDHIDHACCDPADIDKFQQLCAGNRIKPLYFLSYPLLKDAESANYFRQIYGDVDCGLHLHQWVTPPEMEFKGAYYSFQKNLPPDVHRQKLKALAGAFEEVFGVRATAHRAGRYGVAPENYGLLAEIGVEHDFSPSTAFDFSNEGGPDFSGLSNTPFVAADDDWKVFVTPVSGAKAIRGTYKFLSRAQMAPGFEKPRRRAIQPPLMAMRLSPEGADLDDMKALTRRLVADKTPILTFTFHSTSLTPGANPYVKDAGGVHRILNNSREYFDWFRNTIGGEIISLKDLSALYNKP